MRNSLESSLSNYSDAYILVTGNIAVKRRNAADTADIALGSIKQVAFKNCAPFKDCRSEINDTFVDYADFINIAMSMNNLIKYSDNYSDTSGSLWDFKRDEIVNNANVTNDDNAPSFKYKANLIGNTENNGTKNGVKIAVPLKYLSNFWRSLEMPLINCKVELSLKWIENCVLTTAANANKATFEITDAKIYVPIGTLSIEDNAKLSKLLGEVFKRSIFLEQIQSNWKYSSRNCWRKIHKRIDQEKYITELLDSSYQGVKRLFVLAYNNTEGNNQVSIDSSKKYYLPRAVFDYVDHALIVLSATSGGVSIIFLQVLLEHQLE